MKKLNVKCIKMLDIKEHLSDYWRNLCRCLYHSLLYSSHFTTHIQRFFPNWPILRPAPKYTTGLQPKPNCCTISPPFAGKCSNALKSKVSNDFHLRRVSEKWATIQRNCCRKISILGGEEWKLSPFFVFHATISISTYWKEALPKISLKLMFHLLKFVETKQVRIKSFGKANSVEYKFWW